MNNLTLVELVMITLILGGLALIVGLLFFKFSGLSVDIVPQGQKLIIHRLGTFKRIAGPGLVVLRGMETVAQRIDARNQPHKLPVSGLFFKGIPFTYTLEIWYRTALEELTNGDPKRLSEFSEFTDDQRQQMVKTRVFEAMSKSASQIEQEYQPEEKEFFYSLLPLIPGYSANTRMMALAKQRLSDALAAIGLQLDPARDLIISGLAINDKVAAGIGRGQIVRMLRESFPNMPEDMLLEALASIDNLDLRHDRITIQSDSEASVDVRKNADGRAEARVRKVVGAAKTSQKAQGATAKSIAVEQLGAENWAILKPVPMVRAREQMTG